MVTFYRTEVGAGRTNVDRFTLILGGLTSCAERLGTESEARRFESAVLFAEAVASVLDYAAK